MRPAAIGALIIAAVCTLSLPARATVVKAESLEELARNSQIILRGTVTGSQTQWSDGKRAIHTFTEIAVAETLKGGHLGGAVLVRQLGGNVGEIESHVEGVAKFTPGEEVVLFLDRPMDDPTALVLHTMNASKVSFEARLGQTRAVRRFDGLALYLNRPAGGSPITELDKPEDFGTPDVFLRRVKQALKLKGTR